jgi:hypothetical protein
MSAFRSSKGMNALFRAFTVTVRRSSTVQPRLLDQQGHLAGHRRARHQPVVGVEGDAEAEVLERGDRVLGDGGGGARLEVGRRAHLQGDAPVAHPAREPAELARREVRDVVGDPHAVPDALGAAHLEGLVDAGQAVRLPGVDGERHVLAAQVLEGREVVGGREAVLGAGDVEADDSGVAERHGQVGGLAHPVEHPHAAQQGADPHRRARGGRLGHARRQALLDGLDDLGHGQLAVGVQFGGVAHLAVDDTVGRQVQHVLLGRAQQALAGLHHREGVLEGGYVAHQVAGVGGLVVPGCELVRVGGRQGVADRVGQLHHGGGAQAAIEVVVQHGLGEAADQIGVYARSSHGASFLERVVRSGGKGSAGGLEQVPAVAVQVLEDGDGPVRLVPRLLQEGHARGGHPGVVAGEVVGVQEEPDPPTGLVPDPGGLDVPLGAGQQQTGAGSPGAGFDDDPARSVGPGHVLDEPESEGVGVEADRLVVVVDDEGDQGDTSHRGPLGAGG